MRKFKYNDMRKYIAHKTAFRSRCAATGLGGGDCRCRNMVMSEFYGSPREANASLDNFDRYVELNLASGDWDSMPEGTWSSEKHRCQVEALIDAGKEGGKLYESARRRNVDFLGFNFSFIVYEECCRVWRELGVRRSIPFDFSGVCMANAFISSHWFRDVSTFSGADLRGVKVYHDGDTGVLPGGAAGYDVDFTGADLSRADFRFLYLRKSNFSGANLERTDFRGSNLFECRFDGCIGIPILPNDQGSDPCWEEYIKRSELWSADHY